MSQVYETTYRVDGLVDTPSGKLTFANKIRGGINSYWHVFSLILDFWRGMC
jgi:hypothetical protein